MKIDERIKVFLAGKKSNYPYTYKNLQDIVDMFYEDFSSRQIASILFDSPKLKSSINDIINGLGLREIKAQEGVKMARGDVIDKGWAIGLGETKTLAEAVVEACRGANILVWDVETSAAMVGAFQRWNINISQAQVFKEVMILGLCAKWLGSDDIIEIYPLDFSKWDSDFEQKRMLQIIWNLIDKADMTITHNGQKFDHPIINAQFVKHGFPKPSPYQVIDTLRIAKRNFKFPSNGLDALGEYLGVGRKMQHSGFSLWRGCMLGEEESFKEMCDYNAQDVLLLEEVYHKLKSWDHLHPNAAHFSQSDSHVCPVCGSGDLIETGKKTFTSSNEYDLLQCNDCSAWSRYRKANKRVFKTLQGVK